jgi:hypothetical protein
LDNDNTMHLYRLITHSLEPGDLIFSTDPAGFASSVIRLATRGPYSHVALNVNRGIVIEATGEGVRVRDASRIFFSSQKCVAVKRSRLTKQQLRSVVLAVATHGFADYDFPGAITAIIPTPRRPKRRVTKVFCSQLVARAYAAAGFHLVGKNPDRTTPNDLFKSSWLDELPKERLLKRYPEAFVRRLLGTFDSERGRTWVTPLERIQQEGIGLLKAGWTSDQVFLWALGAQLIAMQEELTRQRSLTNGYLAEVKTMATAERQQWRAWSERLRDDLRALCEQKRAQKWDFISDPSVLQQAMQIHDAQLRNAEGIVGEISTRLSAIEHWEHSKEKGQSTQD